MTATLKALSIRQPWAWLIVNGFKDIENRDWWTNFRGPVLIHAGKWFKADEVAEDFADAREIIERAGTARPGVVTLGMLREQTGGIVGRARIVDCVERSASPWFFGRYGFVIADGEPLPFRPLKGALGFFDVAGRT